MAQLCLMLKLQVQTQCRCQIEQKKLEIRILLFSIGCQKLEVKCLRNLGKFYTIAYCYLSNNREAGLVNFSKNIHLPKLYGNTGCRNYKIKKLWYFWGKYMNYIGKNCNRAELIKIGLQSVRFCVLLRKHELDNFDLFLTEFLSFFTESIWLPFLVIMLT